MANVTANPANAEWEVTGPSGAIPLYKCGAYLPITASKPHFLDGEPRLNENSGLSPGIRELHDTLVDVEPITGTTVFVHERLQVNAFIQSKDILCQAPSASTPRVCFPNMTTEYFPIFWLDKAGAATTELAKKFKDDIYGAQTLQKAVKWSCVGISIAGLLGAVLFFITGWKRARAVEAARLEALAMPGMGGGLSGVIAPAGAGAGADGPAYGEMSLPLMGGRR
jgi:hypothetical protein